jgi:hypothetical protein
VAETRDRAGATVPWVPLALVALAALLLRFVALGREGLWCDEGYTAGIVRLSPAEMLRALQRLDDAPPLFYLLTRGATALFGRSEFALRLLPALAGAAAVIGMLIRARRRREWASFWAAAFLGLSAYGVFHARQARGYGLVLALTLGCALAARDLLARPSRGAGLRLSVGGALLVLTHHLGVLVCATSVLLWPLRGSNGPTLRRWLLWHAPPFAVWALYAALALPQFRVHAEQNAWMGEFWRAHPLALAPLLSFGAFVPGALPHLAGAVPFPSREGAAAWLTGISVPLAAALLALAFLPAARLRPARPEALAEVAGSRRTAAVEAAFALAPLLALTLASAVWSPAYVLGRTDAIAFAPFALWLGRGLARLPRGAAAAAVAFWAAVSLGLLAPSYGAGPAARAKGADREVAREMVRQGLRPGDWVVHSYLTAPSLEYHLERLGAPHRAAYFPADAAANPAAVLLASPDSLEARVREARALRERMEREIPADGAAWVPAVVGRGPAAGGEVTAGDLAYPTSVLVYHLAGTRALAPALRYRQDWVGGERVLLRLPRRAWVAAASLGPVRFEGAPAP